MSGRLRAPADIPHFRSLASVLALANRTSAQSGCFGHDLHRAFDQHGVHKAADNRHPGQRCVAQPPERNRRRRRRRKTPNRAAPKAVHIAITPQAENGVGETNSNASTTSGGLVSHKAPRHGPQSPWHQGHADPAVNVAGSSLRTGPARYLPARSGCSNSRPRLRTPANPARM